MTYTLYIYTPLLSNMQTTNLKRTAINKEEKYPNQCIRIRKYMKSVYILSLFFFCTLLPHYSTLISPLASDAGVLEFGDFPIIAFFAFTSDCFTFDIKLFDCFWVGLAGTSFGWSWVVFV